MSETRFPQGLLQLGRRSSRLPALWIVAVLGMVMVAVSAFSVAPIARGASHPAVVTSKKFSMFPNPAFLACAQQAGHQATVKATLPRGSLNDTMTLKLAGFKPGLGFDLFTVQRSNQNSDGSPVSGFTNFGLAWYQSDIETDSDGTASVTIQTILFDQIFGFDPDVSLAPQQTLNVGFWFDSVAEAQPCSANTLAATPFNGEHTAGPLAFITRPNANTGLGPLCTHAVNTGTGFVCRLA